MLRDLDRVILPGLSHWQNPRFFGYFPSNGELSSVLGDYLSTGLGVLGLSWQSSPALTEVEEVVTDWMRQMVGLSDAWSGVIQDTASSCTLVSLLCARERSSDFSLVRAGLQAEASPLVVYVSAHSHSSVEKAALLAGFGRTNIHVIQTDEQYAMRADALRQALSDDLAAGRLTGNEVWTRYYVGQTVALAVDYHRNLVLQVNQSSSPLWALSSMTGNAVWLRSSWGDPIFTRPLVTSNAVYVAAGSSLFKLDPETGDEAWYKYFYLGFGMSKDMAFDAKRQRVNLTGNDGYVYAVDDLGTSAAVAWPTEWSDYDLVYSTGPAFAPAFDKLYVGTERRGSDYDGRIWQLDPTY